MEFNKEDLSVIYSMLKVCIISLNNKRHKNHNDIIVRNKINEIMKKIDSFMESK